MSRAWAGAVVILACVAGFAARTREAIGQPFGSASSAPPSHDATATLPALPQSGTAAGGTSQARTLDQVRPLNELPLSQLRLFLKGFPGDWRKDSAAFSRGEEPLREKPIPPGATLIPLIPPTRLTLGGTPLREAIANRRSLRDFSSAPLSAGQLSFLLWATQGITGIERDESAAVVQLYRAAPSAGGRYPLETYLAIHRVEGLTPGLYRYIPGGHQLQLLKEDPELAGRLQAACYDVPFVRDAAAVFIWSATPRRTEWKYAYLAHRMIAMEAGHVCQNLYLAAEGADAGVCALLSYHQPALDDLLGLDGEEEFTVYLACVGRPGSTGK